MKEYLQFNKYDNPDEFLIQEINRLESEFFNEINIEDLKVFLIKINQRNLVHHRFKPLLEITSKEIPIQKTPQYVKDFSRLIQLGTCEEFDQLDYFSRKPSRRKVFLLEQEKLHEKIATNCHGKALWTNSILKILKIPSRIREGLYYMDFMEKYVIHERPEFFFQDTWHSIEVDNLGQSQGAFVEVKDLEKIEKNKIHFSSYNNVDEMMEDIRKRDHEFLNNDPKPVFTRN